MMDSRSLEFTIIGCKHPSAQAAVVFSGPGDGLCGSIVWASNVDALADAILRCDHNREDAWEMGRRGRKIIHRNFAGAL